ncbi:spermidine/putrescine transport system permease protein [Natranaerovirga pectinivora]|uniref:Spermidine/putrescine transport system permease protein n=1 Tax=Natranaerovirga pectinivora TaxID=682400 RepID=A0A4R3MKY7_9FIRM|nr:ABC transporter permease [Natranaerovirga pectinivora]TCT14626.1 spermidine/putrescine transport system permease protein [Natranaerovirga pectinivora]
MNKRLLSFPYILWIIVFTIVPIGAIFYYGLTVNTPEGLSFTFENIFKITEQVNWKSLRLASWLAFLSTVLCLLLAYPLALILAKNKVGRNSFILFIFVLPMWMNFLLRTYAWLTLLENNGVINSILRALHLPTIHIINTQNAVVLGMVYNFLPFMILPIYNVLVKIDSSLIEAAEDLGANKFQTFFKVIFPLSLPGVISGITMVFVPSVTTFVISNLLGGGKVLLIGNVIENQFKYTNNWHVGSGLSLVLMIFIFISMAVITRYDKNTEGAGLW